MTDLLEPSRVAPPPATPTYLRINPLLLAVAAAAVGLRLYVLARTGGLFGITEYDDGVHYGAAALLLHGVAPYRGQVFLQPPGVTLLLVPFAALGRLFGDATGLAAARVATCVVGGVSTWLVGRLAADRWGRAAGMTAAVVQATAATSLVAESTVMLEPYLGLLTVLALRVLSRSKRPGSALLAGLLLGSATAVKAWGVVTLLVVIGWLAVYRRSLVRPLALGAVVAGAVIGLPFLLLAPAAMVHDVVVTQLTRPYDGVAPVASRLADMVGVRSLLSGHPGAMLAAGVALGVLVVSVVVAAVRRDALARLSAALLGAGLLTLALAPVFFTHYTDFLVPFVALLAGAAVGSLRRPALTGRVARVAVAVAVAAFAGVQVTSATLRTHPSRVNVAALQRAVPRTGCVLTETPTLAELAGTLARPQCPNWLDPRGTALTHASVGRMSRFYPDGFRRLPAWQGRWLEWAARSQAIVVIGDPCMHPEWTELVCHDLDHRFPDVTVVGTHRGDPTMRVEVRTRR